MLDEIGEISYCEALDVDSSYEADDFELSPVEETLINGLNGLY